MRRSTNVDEEREFQKHFFEIRRELDPQWMTQSATREIALHEEERREDRANGVDVAESPKVAVIKDLFMGKDSISLNNVHTMFLQFGDRRKPMTARQDVHVCVRQPNGEYADWVRCGRRRLQPALSHAFASVQMAVRSLPRQQALDASGVLVTGLPSTEVARRRGVGKTAVSRNISAALPKLAKQVSLAALNAASLALSDHRYELQETRRKLRIDMAAIIEPAPLTPGQKPEIPRDPRDLPWPLCSLVSEASRKAAQLQYTVARLMERSAIPLLAERSGNPVKKTLRVVGDRGLSTKVGVQRLTPAERGLLEQEMPEVETVVRKEVRVYLQGEDLGDSGLSDNPRRDDELERPRRTAAAGCEMHLRPSHLHAQGFNNCTPGTAGEAAAYQRIAEDWPRICRRPEGEWKRLIVVSAKHGVADARRDRESKGWHTRPVTGKDALAVLIERAGGVARVKTDAGAHRGTIGYSFSENAAGEIDGAEIMTAFGPVTVALADVREISWPDREALCSVSLACETQPAEGAWEKVASAYEELCHGDAGAVGM